MGRSSESHRNSAALPRKARHSNKTTLLQDIACLAFLPSVIAICCSSCRIISLFLQITQHHYFGLHYHHYFWLCYDIIQLIFHSSPFCQSPNCVPWPIFFSFFLKVQACCTSFPTVLHRRNESFLYTEGICKNASKCTYLPTQIHRCY